MSSNWRHNADGLEDEKQREAQTQSDGSVVLEFSECKVARNYQYWSRVAIVWAAFTLGYLFWLLSITNDGNHFVLDGIAFIMGAGCLWLLRRFYSLEMGTMTVMPSGWIKFEDPEYVDRQISFEEIDEVMLAHLKQPGHFHFLFLIRKLDPVNYVSLKMGGIALQATGAVSEANAHEIIAEIKKLSGRNWDSNVRQLQLIPS